MEEGPGCPGAEIDHTWPIEGNLVPIWRCRSRDLAGPNLSNVSNGPFAPIPPVGVAEGGGIGAGGGMISQTQPISNGLFDPQLTRTGRSKHC